MFVTITNFFYQCSIILMGVAISSYNRVHSDRPRPASMYVPTDKIIKDGQA